MRNKTSHRFVSALGALALLACQSGADGDSPAGGSDAPAPPTDRVLRRLTRFEYDSTIKDLLGFDAQQGQTLPPEDVVSVFDNNAGALRVGPLMADKLQVAAETIADLVVKNLPPVLGCDPKLGRACAESFVRSFGLRALRRPLTDAEVARYLKLHDDSAADGGFNEGIRAVIATLLQSPHFIYRTELGTPAEGGVYQLTPYEVASELSYFLWGSMPDAELLRAAQAKELTTPAQIAAQARRLLKSPRSRPVMDHFARQWLLLDRLFNAPKDDKLYPTFTTAIRAAMDLETTAFFDSVIRGGGKLPELLSASYSLMSPALAQFYGLSAGGQPDAQGLVKVTLPDGVRQGFLTHGSILSTQAKPDSASPVHRGKLVRERLLCQTLPPPPPGVVIQLPAIDPMLSNRARFSEHSKNPACAGCHRQMDPIGLGFERFNAVGQYSAMNGAGAIDDSGEVLFAPTAAGPFQGAAALATRLAQAPEVHECFARQWFRFSYGIEEDERTEAQVTQVVKSFKDQQLVIPELLVALTQVPRFTQRAADADLPGQPAPAPSPDMSGGTPPPPPPPPSMYSSMVKRDSDWATGYCSTVVVQNDGKEGGDWAITISVEGKINNLWNAVQEPAGAQITFRGMSYNKTLAPGASTSFGFCATK